MGVIPKKDGLMVRLSLKPGYLSCEQLIAIGKIAKKYGFGKVHLTTRQGLEFKIKYENLEKVEELLEKEGINIGSTGTRIRQIVCCIGSECYSSIGDSVSLARKLHDEFEGIWVPKKLKINVSGCPNNCTHHQFCDIGIYFRYILELDKEKCTECGKCENFCEINAIDRKNKIIKENCIGKGDCLKLCDAINVVDKVISIHIGGKGGKFPKTAKHLIDVKTEDEVLEVVDILIEMYSKFGKGRIYDFIKEFGIDYVKQKVQAQLND